MVCKSIGRGGEGGLLASGISVTRPGWLMVTVPYGFDTSMAEG